jgi:AhpD family alkylhydroperoxidase
MKPFTKRTFTLPLLLQSLGAALVTLPVLLLAYFMPATSRALREKVMLGVTSVNDCRYCSWAHTGLALANGIDLDELTHLLDHGSFGNVTGREATAILFAKHYADTVRHPSEEALAAFSKEFTAYERAEIMAYIHFIYYSNLSGNSADAWLARLSGRKVANGHPLPEAVAALIAAPILFIGSLIARKVRPEAMKALDADEAAAPSAVAAPATQDDDGRVTVEIWSDVMCPFCYIAKRKFDAALADFPGRDHVDIVWKSFQLDADLKSDPDRNVVEYTASSKRIPQLLASKALAEIASRARDIGLHFDFEKAVVANTFDALRLSHFAAAHGKGSEMEEALFKAYFVDGTNTADHAVLTRIAVDLGLPEKEVKHALASGAHADEVRQDIAEASQIGVKGVPYFRFNRHQAVSGLQGTNAYAEALEKALADSLAAITRKAAGAGAVCDLQGNCG